MQKESFNIVGYSVRTQNLGTQAMDAIGTLWTKVLSKNLLDNIPNKIRNEVFVVYYNYAGDYTAPYTCLIGIPVSQTDSLPEGATAICIPRQEYQVFEAKGTMPDALVQTWQKIWQTPLPRNYQFDFEVYNEKSFSKACEVEIYIGMQA